MAFCGCSHEMSSPFHRERSRVEKTLSAVGELLKTNEIKQSGTVMECSWDYEFAGEKSAAVSAFRKSQPNGYAVTSVSDSELVFGRFDGHDTFQVSLKFARSPSTDRVVTAVSAVLRGYPD